MTSAFIFTTLILVGYSLWVRRDTWWSRWEIGVTVGLTLETVGLVLVSPWVSETGGPWLHRAVRMWNILHLVGHICFVFAVTANIAHVLPRVASWDQIGPWFRRRVVRPVQLGTVTMVALFIAADADYHPHGFSSADGNVWQNAYWVLWCGLMCYLATVATRLLLIVRADPRAKETVELYAASTAFGLAGLLAQLSTTWIDADLSTLVWLSFCISIAIFAIGSARSWQAKAAWFHNSEGIQNSNPPQALT